MDAVDYILAVSGSKAYADSLLTAFARFKGVCTASALPASPSTGDVYLVSDDFTIGEVSYSGGSYVGWNGSAWQVLPKQAYVLIDSLTSDSASAALTAKQGKALKTLIDSKSAVSVSESGTATDEIHFITVDGVEKKLPSGGGGGGASITIVTTDPTSATVGTVGAMQFNSSNGVLWTCVSVEGGTYTWKDNRRHVYEVTITETS